MFPRHIYSHYFTSGLTVATGVIGLGAIAYLLFGPAVAAGVSLGASCVSINDVPTPRRHKVALTLAAMILTTLAHLAIGLSRTGPLHEALGIMAISFVAAMLTLYGKRMLPLSFSMIFAMIMGMAGPAHPWSGGLHQALLFGAGALVYGIYTVVVAEILAFRTRQQALGEVLQSLAAYLRRQGDFYNPAISLEDCYQAIIAQKAAVADNLQVARDLVFRTLHTSKDGMLAATLMELLELFERMLSNQVDYALLRESFPDSDLLTFFRDVALKAGQDLENIGLTLMKGRLPRGKVSCKAELIAIDATLREAGMDPSGLEVALAARRRLGSVLAQVDVIRRAARTPIEPDRALKGAPVGPFLSRMRFAPRMVLGHISLRSQVLRYAIRLSLAMGCGFLVTRVLPYASHGYWVLLTVAVVMRSSYSQTRQRHWDRIAGNLLGCVFTAFLLWATPNPVVLAGAAFLSMVITQAFVAVNYRYSATAACVMGLLFIHFLAPSTGFVVLERLLDTIVGAALAWGFSFILPNWESSGLPGLCREVMEASRSYALETLGAAPELQPYRLARKRMIDAVSALCLSVGRMAGEPEHRRGSLAPLNEFLTAGFLLAAQLASVHGMLPGGGEGQASAAADRVVEGLAAGEPPVVQGDPPSDPLGARLELIVAAARRLGAAARHLECGISALES
nr:FUSC family membrane protein [uncultured Holophaga sp.]